MFNKAHLLRLTALASALVVGLLAVTLLVSSAVPVRSAVLPTQLAMPTLPAEAKAPASSADARATSLLGLPDEARNAALVPPMLVDHLLPSRTPAATYQPQPEANAAPTQQIINPMVPTALPFPTLSLPQALPFPTLPVVPEPGALPARVLLPDAPVANQLVITFQPDTSVAERETYIQSLGGQVVQRIDVLDTIILTIPQAQTTLSLLSSSAVAASEPDYYVSALVAVPPSDPLYSQQWALPVIGAPDAWLALPADAPKVTVAVIDSGICANHPELAGRILPGWDFVEDDNQPQDDFGHGCNVAGIIAANADNSAGIAGVAPNALILPLRVLDGQGLGTYSNVAAAIVYAADHGAQVVNLSLGGIAPSTLLEQAVTYAVGKGVTVVAAAGNNGNRQLLYPAAYEPVISVGSVDQDMQISSFSSGGANVDLLAPGRDILSLKPDGSYSTMTGTSFAAPHVAGVAAIDLAFGDVLVTDGALVQSKARRLELSPTQPTPFYSPTPTVIAQTLPPSLTVDFGPYVGDPQLRQAVIEALLNRPNGIFPGSQFRITDERTDQDWSLLSIASLDGPDSSVEFVGTGASGAMLIASKLDPSAWRAALAGTEDFTRLLERAPELFILPEARPYLDPRVTPQGVSNLTYGSTYRFPWASGTLGFWQYRQGWHDRALDIGTQSADKRVLAAADGWVTDICRGIYTANVHIVHLDGKELEYFHIDLSTLDAEVQMGGGVFRGQPLGNARSGSFSWDGCGQAPSQLENSAHLHWVIPLENDEEFTVDGWTIKYDDNTWKKGTETRIPTLPYQLLPSNNYPIVRQGMLYTAPHPIGDWYYLFRASDSRLRGFSVDGGGRIIFQLQCDAVWVKLSAGSHDIDYWYENQPIPGTPQLQIAPHPLSTTPACAAEPGEPTPQPTISMPPESIPPSGTWTSPSNGQTISTSAINLSVNASDNSGGSGVREVRFSAKWNGAWQAVGNDTIAPYSLLWDWCAAGVPNGDVELGMEVWDNANNKWVYSEHFTNIHVTKNYSSPCSSSPSPTPNPSTNVILWEHPDYTGQYQTFGGVGSYNVTSSMNDLASSVQVPSGWSVQIFEHADQQGAERCLSGNVPNLASYTFDNVTSSLKVFDVPGCPAIATSQWDVTYFDNIDFTNQRCTETITTAMFSRDWPQARPCQAIGIGETWSARFTASFYLAGGTYVLHAEHDDGIRWQVDGQLILASWSGADDTWSNEIQLSSGVHSMTIEFRQNFGGAHLSVNWYGPSGLPWPPPTPTPDPGQSLLPFPSTVPPVAFGDGADGDVTVVAGQTLFTDNVRTPLTADADVGASSIAVGDASGFSVGRELLIIGVQGPTAGRYSFGRIASTSGTQIVLTEPLDLAFYATSGAKSQVMLVPNYHDLTVQNGGLVVPHAWDGATGGVVAFRVSGTLFVDDTGLVSATGRGFRGAARNNTDANGIQGEGEFAGSDPETSANHMGGGGGCSFGYGNPSGGGGGGYNGAGQSGQPGNNNDCQTPGSAGNGQGSGNLTVLFFGGGGGAGGGTFLSDSRSYGGAGGTGGGVVLGYANSLQLAGKVEANGGNGETAYGSNHGGNGGGGAGGSVFLIYGNGADPSAHVGALSGLGGTYGGSTQDAGDGAGGRVRLLTTQPPATIPPTDFGTGADGDVTVPSCCPALYTDTVWAALTASASFGQDHLQVSSTSGFAVGDEILILQMQGLGAGQYEFARVAALESGGLILQTPLRVTYTVQGVSRAQVLRVPNYQNLTVLSGGVVTPRGWDGVSGGVIAFRVAGTLTIQPGGIISANGTGFRGAPRNNGTSGVQGESASGLGINSYLPNGTGGGGACSLGYGNPPGGGGGGHATAGTNGNPGNNNGCDTPGYGGGTLNDGNLAQLNFGGGGGSGGGNPSDSLSYGGGGGGGGGIIVVFARSVEIGSSLTSLGGVGLTGYGSNRGSNGGGGGGGSILFIYENGAIDGTDLVVTGGGGGSYGSGATQNGGPGGDGRTRLVQDSEPVPNQAPLADAGADQTIVDLDGNGHELVILDGSASIDADGSLESYTWYEDNFQLASGITAQVDLTVGTHEIELMVTDNTGAQSADTITVVVSPNTAPTISNILTHTVDEDTPTGAISFTIGDAESLPDDLILSASSSNTSRVPNANIVFGGSGAYRTVTVTPAANKFGSAVITVTVSDGSLSDSDTFTLKIASINDAPTITNLPNTSTNRSTPVTVNFTIGDVENSASTLTVTKSSNNPALVPNSGISISGSGANRSAAITPTLDQLGSATITLCVSDGALSTCDDFVLSVVAPPDPIFSDGFESGNFSVWSSRVVDNGDLAVIAAAQLTGNNYGMRARINDTNDLYVQDDTPSAESRYRARFYFDPNTVTMANGDRFTLFSGYRGASVQVLQVEMRRSGSNYQIRSSVRDDGAVWTYTAYYTFSDAPHIVEIDWQAATAVGANNGSLAFWIDENLMQTLGSIDNDTRRIDTIRLGAVTGLDAGTRGVLYFDAFRSTRLSYIGAEIGGLSMIFEPEPTETPRVEPTAQVTPSVTVEPTAQVTPAATDEPSETPTPEPTLLPFSVPVFQTMDDGAPLWSASAGWQLSADAAYSGLGWQASASGNTETLTLNVPVNLAGTTAPALGFQSKLVSGALPEVQVSTDGTTWQTVSTVTPSLNWALVSVDLSAYAGQTVRVQFVWSSSAAGETWQVDEVTIADGSTQPPIEPTLPPVQPTFEIEPTGTPGAPAVEPPVYLPTTIPREGSALPDTPADLPSAPTG